MDTDAFLDAVKDEQKTELSRLGSSKSLYADTEGEMETDAVLRAVADLLSHAEVVVESWADESEGAAADLFDSTVTTLGEAYGTVAGELGDHDQGDRPPVVATLADQTDTKARAGALVGYLLVAEKKIGQAVGFFVGQAAPGAADTFRGVRESLNDAIDTAVDALGDVCADEDDWTIAENAAVETVGAAYDDYFETLESLGVNPKPVC
jgi:hypothetical protein